MSKLTRSDLVSLWGSGRINGAGHAVPDEANLDDLFDSFPQLESTYLPFVHGAVGDGATNDTSALYTLINTTINGDDATLLIDRAYKSNTLTVPANVTLVFLKGGSLVVPTGQTITVNGPVVAGAYEIFDLSGTGDVDVNNALFTYAQWWNGAATPSQTLKANVLCDNGVTIDGIDISALTQGNDASAAIAMIGDLGALNTAATGNLVSAINEVHAGAGGENVSDNRLIEWTEAEAYEATSITRDSDEVPTTATIKWPDGATGTLTVTKDTTWIAIKGYSITHVYNGHTKTVTQADVTRNANGSVTTKPALTVA